MKNTLMFLKLNENAIIPSKREEDAGYDIYMLPEKTEIIILPGETYIAKTGLKTAFSSDYVLLGRERGK